MVRADVVVIGAGVMGAAAAWRLTLAGRSVVLLEQFEVGHDRGSSHGSVRVFRFSYHDPQYVLMAMEALPLWRELERASGQDILTVIGGFDVGPAERLEAHARALGTSGARYELLTGKDVMGRFPSVSLAADTPVLYQPDAGVLSAERAVRSMVDRAAANGATLSERTPAHDLRQVGDGVEVATGEGTVTARVAVVTAGAWARQLLTGAGIDLPVTPSRETVAFFSSRDETDFPGFPIFVEWTDGPLYALPSAGDGLKTGWHYSGPDADPDVPGTISPPVIERMSAWVAERFPGAATPARRAESCLYTNTSDERFILERHGSVVVGSACSGHGFKFAPLIGERLAGLALGG